MSDKVRCGEWFLRPAFCPMFVEALCTSCRRVWVFEADDMVRFLQLEKNCPCCGAEMKQRDWEDVILGGKKDADSD